MRSRVASRCARYLSSTETSGQGAGSSAAHALAEVVRREWPAVVATLVRVTGDLNLAEDAAQDAAVEALSAWSTELPRSPTGWIISVARRRAIDRIRREATGRRKTELLGRLESWDQPSFDDPAEQLGDLDSLLRDDQLKLVFGCCHPALSETSQVALTLHSVGGLSVDEIANGFLVPRPTMAQRIVRAKRKIATANIPFALPPDEDLLGRLETVHAVLYLIFNEGYAASGGDDHLRTDLCVEAIRLARLAAELVPDDAETLALVALMLATHARAASRTDSDGVPILLDEQDRSQWDHTMIAEAELLLERSLRLRARGVGPLAIQAAIAMVHTTAASAADTDWPQIELLYRKLVAVRPTPIVEVNHAVAIAMAAGPEQGLALLDQPHLIAALADYRYFHAARADLLAKLDRRTESNAAYDRAIALSENGPEATLLRRKRDR